VSAARGFDRLWSPWRMAYIAQAASSAGRSGRGGRAGRGASAAAKAKAVRAGGGDCLFCRVVRSRRDRENLVLARTSTAVLMLNRFPYNPAHLMVAVARHLPRFADLGPADRAGLLELTALAERALEAEYRPDGINAGVNLGRVAGAGFPGHLHLHLVPRWNGDTNFMPVIGATRVLPESLARTWSRLKRALTRLEPPGPGVPSRG
jgi:ATP adenylyltransferase